MANTKIKEIVEFAAPEGIGAEDVLRGIHVLKAFYQQKEGFYGIEVGGGGKRPVGVVVGLGKRCRRKGG